MAKTLSLEDHELRTVAICLLACSKSGGGSLRYGLYRHICEILGDEPESFEVVAAQEIAAQELKGE